MKKKLLLIILPITIILLITGYIFTISNLASNVEEGLNRGLQAYIDANTDIKASSTISCSGIFKVNCYLEKLDIEDSDISIQNIHTSFAGVMSNLDIIFKADVLFSDVDFSKVADNNIIRYVIHNENDKKLSLDCNGKLDLDSSHTSLAIKVNCNQNFFNLLSYEQFLEFSLEHPDLANPNMIETLAKWQESIANRELLIPALKFKIDEYSIALSPAKQGMLLANSIIDTLRLFSPRIGISNEEEIDRAGLKTVLDFISVSLSTRRIETEMDMKLIKASGEIIEALNNVLNDSVNNLKVNIAPHSKFGADKFISFDDIASASDYDIYSYLNDYDIKVNAK